MRTPSRRPVLITGGAGFIGTNLASRFMRSGERVLVFDDCSCPTAEQNLESLRHRYRSLLAVERGDLRDAEAVDRVVRSARAVIHLAGQSEVPKSLADPRHDLEVNLLGTFNLLEAIRSSRRSPPIVFASTAQVYGTLDSLDLQVREGRYTPLDPSIARYGISETQPLAFCNPHACSKGAADLYILDYARSFDLPAVVLRLSTVYGPHQRSTEEGGWIARLITQSTRDEEITVYGDGRQVRDLLDASDLADAFVVALRSVHRLSGRAFNIGGGPCGAVSVLELLDLIRDANNGCLSIRFEPWRSGDRRYYVSDTRSFSVATGWRPHISPAYGIRRLFEMIRGRRSSDEIPPHAGEFAGHVPVSSARCFDAGVTERR
jgi:CDP-paratose 2-epimerase